MSSPDLSPDEEAAVVERYLSGETSVELGECFDMDPHDILNVLHQNLVQVRPKGSAPARTADKRERLLHMIEDMPPGQTVASVAQRMGIPPGRLRERIRRARRMAR